jgi:hypothetical protein
VSVLLIVLGCALAPISVLGVWTANQVSDTDRYIANVAPLIREPAVRGALTDKIAAAVSRQVDVQGVARQAATQLSRRGLSRLSALLSNFSGSIASAVKGLIHSTVAKAVSRPLAPDAAAGSGRRGGRTRVHLLVKPDRPGCAADRHHARGRAQPDRTARQASGQAEDRAPRQLGRERATAGPLFSELRVVSFLLRRADCCVLYPVTSRCSLLTDRLACCAHD